MTRMILIGLWLWALSLSQTAAAEAHPSVAFYYGSFSGIDAPWELAVAYDRLVVEPGHDIDVRRVAARGAELIAYVSVGEVNDGAVDRADIDPSWVLGRNADWRSAILDVSQPGYQIFVIDKVKALVAAGYAGVFLDTLDSYQRVASNPVHREQLRRSLTELVSGLSQQVPAAKILLNRGFELLPEVGSLVHGVVAESLFDRYEAGTNSYSRVPEADYRWLVGKLREARDRYGLPVTVIDYRPPAERQAARSTAERIASLGFTPYVVDGGLQTAGVGAVDVVPRRVLLVSLPEFEQPWARGGKRAFSLPAGYRLLAPVLEQLGAVVDVLSPAGPLPQRPLAGTYQGLVSFLPNDFESADYASFLQRQLAAGLPVVVFGGPGVPADSRAFQALGLQGQDGFRQGGGPLTVAQRSALVGFEADPPSGRFTVGHGVNPAVIRKPHLVFRDSQQRRRTVIATTQTGGLALSHFTHLVGPHGYPAWVIDPFAFLQSALQLTAAPRVVVHTDYGSRLGLVVVRGTGVEQPTLLPGRPLAFFVIRSRLLSRYGLLHSVVSWSAAGEPVEGRAAEYVARLGRAANARLCEADPAFSAAPFPHTLLWTTTQPLAYPTPSDLLVPVPIGSDLHYVENSPQSYPIARVERSWRLTGTPRRLAAAALDYHAYAVASPGGLSAMVHLHAALQKLGVYPVYFDEYQRRVRSFRDAVLIRRADGFELRGAGELHTLALPPEVGHVDWQRSRGILAVGRHEREDYVTLDTGLPGRLVVSSEKQAAPAHIASANVELLAVGHAAQQPMVVDLRYRARVSPKIRFAGLPAGRQCRFATRRHTTVGSVDPSGSLTIELEEVGEGAGQLRCVATAGR